MDTAPGLAEVSSFLHVYFLPVLIVIGIVGNITIAWVYWKGEGSSTTTFFISLAVSDLGYTLTLVIYLWLRYTFGWAVTASVYYCNLIYYFGSTFAYVSNITVAMVTLERVLAVTVPHRVKIFCSCRRSVVVVVGLWCSVLLVNTHSLVGYGDFAPDNGTLLEQVIGCKFRYDWYATFVGQVLIYVELILFVLAEILIIVIGNITIVVCLYRSGRGLNSTQRGSQARAVTAKTVAISIFHTVCILPWIVFTAIISGQEVSEETGQFYGTIATLLLFCSHLQATFNIFLYMFFGDRFRQAVKTFLVDRFRR